jgi:hypothetical protein
VPPRQAQTSPPPQIRQPEAPQIITRDLPTDMPQTQTVTAAQPKPVPADRESPKPAEPARRAEAEPEPVRPAQRRSPAEFATPNGLPAPETRTETRERVIEKIVRENAVMAEKEPPVRSGALTAHSVSKIGALPTRRRAHTIFGLRRG